MHARTLHGRQGLDGAGEFTLQTPLEIEPLLKLRHAKLAGLHQFEPGHRAFGQTLGGQPQPHVVHPICRNQDGTAAVGMLVGHVHLGQLGHDGAPVLVVQVGEQHPVVGLAAKHDGCHGNGHQQRNAHPQTHALGPIQRRHPLQP